MCWILPATTFAEAASLDAELEICSIRSARRRDTWSISVSAVPALSDSLAPFHHTLRRALHSGYGILGIGLNRFHQSGNLAGCIGRTLSQPLHLFCNHREAASGLTGRRCLNGGIQREYVGLLGNVGDQLGDFANLL